MRRLLLGCMILFCATFRSKAQTYENQPFDSGITHDFAWAYYDHPAFDMAQYAADPSAHALVLKEFGKAWISSNGNNTSLFFEYHVKIKIFDSKAFDKGHIEIPFYIQDNGTYEEIRTSSVQGITYYRETNGAMHSVDLNADSISIIKKNKHWSAVKFNMPNISNGCIIEYKYRFESPFLDKFKTWKFQSDIPKIYSEYEVHIPSVFGYNISLRGPLKLTKDTVYVEKNCFESTNLKSDCHVEDYRIDNIPAFKTEPYLSSPENYLSGLHFQVTSTTQLNNFVNLNQAFQKDVAEDWTEADKSLKYNDNFGTQLHKSVFKDKMATILSGKTDDLEKANAIYSFIQHNITFDGENSIYADYGIKKALDKHTGNAADVNLALTNALKEAGITADAVIISTRDNGLVNNAYPALTEFNYVITVTMINNKVYLLDATDPLLPFGMLPLRDLNYRGRVIPADKPSYWVNLATPQLKTVTTTFDLTLDTSGKLTGEVTNYSKGYAAYEKNLELSKYKPVNAGLSATGLTVIKTDTNTDNTGSHLTQAYNVQVNNQDKTGAGNFTFAPFMLGKLAGSPYSIMDTLTGNPFTAATRTNPVDFGMPSAYSFTLTLHLPAGYKIDTPPQDLNYEVANSMAMLATFSSDGQTATYMLTYNLDKPMYDVAEYANLRALFEKITAAEQATISIKKE